MTLGHALVVRRPVGAHGQAELVDLARRLAVHRERAHRARRAALHLLLQPRVRDHEAAAVEHVVTDQLIEPFAQIAREGGRLGGELLHRLGEAMTDGDLAARQVALELVVVVADNRQRLASVDHRFHEPEHIGRTRAAVD